MVTPGENTGADRHGRFTPGQMRQPAACAACTAGNLLALSDERDQWLARTYAAWREGYRAAELDHAPATTTPGTSTASSAGKHAEHQAVEALRLYTRRWELRGEPRTRTTFGQPHPDDCPGTRRSA